MKTKIILVRHAESEGNIQNRLSGRTNFNLTPKGLWQIEKLADELEKEHIEIIYSSPLKRAYITAQGIAKKQGLKNINIQDDLIEMDFGKCDGLSWDEIDEKYPNVRIDWKQTYNYPINIPDQEDFLKFQERFYNTIKSIANKNLGKTICIVTHGTAIRSFMALLNNVKVQNLNTINCIHNAAFCILEYENNKFNVLNEEYNKHVLKSELKNV